MKNSIQRLILCIAISMLSAGCITTVSEVVPTTKVPVNKMPVNKVAARDSRLYLLVLEVEQLQQDLGLKSQPLFDSAAKLRLFIKQLNLHLSQPEPTGLSTVTQLVQHIQSRLPRHDQFVRLRTMIQHYQTLDDVKWPELADVGFRLGQRHTEVAKLRTILTLLGDLAATEPDDYRDLVFGPDIIDGLKRFQRRHGIAVTGELTEETVKELNVTPKARIRQMQTNLWRWLSLPLQLPLHYVRVNIPDFQLMVYKEQQLFFNMPVIVGKPDWPTPRLTTTLTRLTIHPTWTPPRSIIRADLLPRHKEQPGFLSQQGFELQQGPVSRPLKVKIPNSGEQQLESLLRRYRLVQKAGPRNALGSFRFSIVNNQAIFLHDTPAKYLFARQSRALSHGCIRLADAALLSRYLFEHDPGLKNIGMGALLRETTTRSFSLAKPVPVFITYHTSWVDSLGILQLRPDIYHLDQGG